LTVIHAQEGVGVVREGTINSIASLNEFNPLLCATEACQHLQRKLLPGFGYVDPTTARWEPAVIGSNALVTSWSQSPDGRDYTFTLRDDLTWSNGQPVTAYDVLFTLTTLAPPSTDDAPYRFGFAAPNTTTFVLTLDEPQCDLSLLSLRVIPYHPFAPDFQQIVETTVVAPTVKEQTAQWAAFLGDYNFSKIRNQPFSLDPLTTNESPYTLSSVRTGVRGEIRLDGTDGDHAYVLAATSNPVESFIRGETNYLTNFPYERVGDVASVGGGVISQPGTGVYALALNFADPTEARPFDTDSEDGQGIHPVWADRRVRQAVSLAIDVQPIIDVAFLGHGTPVRGIAPSGAWYEADDLSTPTFNRAEAERLLTEAGWRPTGNSRLRECVTCTTAPPGSRLSVRLGYREGNDPRSRTVATELSRQLLTIGFEVNLVETSGTNRQTADANLVYIEAFYPYTPESTFRQFGKMNDTIVNGTSGPNITSYSNPQVDDLLARAQAMPNCADYNQRAAFYQEAQRQIVAEDIAYIPLFAPHDLTAVARGVRGFDPLPNAPDWNITDWIVTEGGTP